MTSDRGRTRLSDVVQVLDWESGVPDSRAVRKDPRMPSLPRAAGFTSSMAADWGPADRTLTTIDGTAAATAAHRARLSAALPGRTLVVAAGRSHQRANDTFFEFRAASDFLWLVGHGFEDAVILLRPTAGGHDATLYVTPPLRSDDPGFYADPLHGELWVGPTPGLAEITAALDIATAPLTELSVPDDALIAGSPVVARGAGAALSGRARSAELARVLAELRQIKDAWEIGRLRAAVEATAGGFEAVLREIPAAIAGGGERWLQGTFDRVARTAGQAPGYASIVGSGAHAPILHWVRADGEVTEGDLLLLDMGIEMRCGYTADVTRTVPVSGSYTAAQRDVYDLVEASHRAGMAAVAPGRPWIDIHVACMEVLARGLADWGLLGVSVDEALSADGQQHRRYIVCGVGHHLGLDVHDCSSSRYETYLGGTLAEGMALTVEPGLYFHANDLTVPEELRGMGIRIEDDLVVTATGHEVLSAGLPIDAPGTESWLAGLR